VDTSTWVSGPDNNTTFDEPPSQSRYNNPPPVPTFFIDRNGRTYVDNMYVGQAQHLVSHKTGRGGWHFKIPMGWAIWRYDGESVTQHGH
jgi:hypothetical protein